MTLNRLLTNIWRHLLSGLRRGWEPRVQTWLLFRMGCGSGRHSQGSTQRPPRRGSAARAGVGTMPALCFLAGVSLSPASLVCKMGATTHHRGAAGRAAAPPQCWSLSPDRLHGHWCPRLVQSLAKILSLFSLRYRLLLSSVPFSDF